MESYSKSSEPAVTLRLALREGRMGAQAEMEKEQGGCTAQGWSGARTGQWFQAEEGARSSLQKSQGQALVGKSQCRPGLKEPNAQRKMVGNKRDGT